MNICMLVLNTFRPDVRVLKEASTLVRQGHRVTVLAVRDKQSLEEEWFDGVRVVRLKLRSPNQFAPRRLLKIVDKRRLRSVSAKPAAPLAAASKINGKPMSKLEGCRGGLRGLLDGTCMKLHWRWRLQELYHQAQPILHGERFDVIHTHDLNTLPVGARIAAEQRARLVYDSHELYPEASGHSPLESRFWADLERQLIHRADAVITVSDSIAEELKSRYRLARPPIVLLNAPPRPALPPAGSNRIRQAAGIADDEPVVLYQGGFAPNRGLENLIEAAGRFQRGTLVFMGWGKIEADLRRLAADRGLDGRVRFIPAVPQDVLLEWTSSADLGLIPYRAVGLNNYYSCPNKLFEYISAGIAIAGSGFPELTRFITGYGVGLTFDPEDPADIARAVNEILASPSQLATMRANARSAGADLNWQAQEPKLMAIYDGLAHHQPQAAAVCAS